MDQFQALQVLIDGVNVAQKRGAYNLQEAGALLQAVSVFARPTSTRRAKNTQADSEVATTQPVAPQEAAPTEEPEKKLEQDFKQNVEPQVATNNEETEPEPEKKGWFGRSRGSFFANGPIGMK
jgi:hypothetical protein